MHDNGMAWSNNGALHRHYQRYEENLQITAYQNVDPFYYDADLERKLSWNPEWALNPPFRGMANRQCLRLIDLDPLVVDRPSNRLDQEAPTPIKLCQGEQKELNRTTGSDLPKATSGNLVREHRFQVFIKNLEGKTKILWVKGTDTVEKMQEIIMQQLGYPIRIQNLIHEGSLLQDTKYLWEYRITPLSTIILNLRLRGGATNSNKNTDRAGGSGTGSIGKKPGNISFKNAL